MRLRYPLALLGLAVALGVVLLVLLLKDKGGSGASFRGSIPPSGIALPPFSLRDQNGRVMTSTDLHGKAAVVTFLDTNCRESCPVVANDVGQGLRLLDSSDRSNVAAIAITVDPERDSPRAARAFLRAHRAAGTMRYLLGTRRELDPVWQRFSVLAVAPGGNSNVHSAPVRIYDPGGTWVSTLAAGADLTPANLAHDVRSALSD